MPPRAHCGAAAERAPSRFLDELPAEHAERERLTPTSWSSRSPAPGIAPRTGRSVARDRRLGSARDARRGRDHPDRGRRGRHRACRGREQRRLMLDTRRSKRSRSAPVDRDSETGGGRAARRDGCGTRRVRRGTGGRRLETRAPERAPRSCRRGVRRRSSGRLLGVVRVRADCPRRDGSDSRSRGWG